MLSWKTTRVVCIVMLLLPIVHLAYLVSQDALAILDPSPNVWDRELEAYAREDRATTLPQQPIVVVGGRRVTLWKSLPDTLADKPILMRGLGDAIVEDILYNYTALIGYYQPSAVVLFPSHSEFHIRDSKSAETLFAAIQELEAEDARHGITQQLYIFTPLRSLMFPRDDVAVERITRLLQDWAATMERVTIIDGNAVLQDSAGKPKADYYLNDGVNLNDAGYLRLAILLQSTMADNMAAPAETPATP